MFQTFLIFVTICCLVFTAVSQFPNDLLVESLSQRMTQRKLGEAADTKIEGTSGKLFKGNVIRTFDGTRFFEHLTTEALQKKYKEHASSKTALKPMSDRRCSQWAVVTTINDPTDAVERQALEEDWCLVIIGDRKGPRSYPLPNAANWTVFLDDKAQETFAGEHPLGKLLPWNHFGRKNIGFIFAILHGAKSIFDFDDDNMLLDISPAMLARESTRTGHMRGGGGLAATSHPSKPAPHGRLLPIAANNIHHNTHHSTGEHGKVSEAASTTSDAAGTTGAAVAATTAAAKVTKNVLTVPGVPSKLSNNNGVAEGLYVVNIPYAYNFSVLNPYPLMGATASPAWPRGYPLHLIKSTYHNYFSSVTAADPNHHSSSSSSSRTNTHSSSSSSSSVGNNFVLRKATVPASSIGVVQYLAGNDPDVDAIYRLIQPLPLNFGLSHHPLLLPLHNAQQAQVYCPYNAQATMHTQQALWTLLLPITVHGRVSDIWRSYFAQRLMADLDLSLVFHPPYIVQYRNSHNYLADFDSEGPLYLEAGMLIEQLSQWFSCAKTLPERMESLWIMLYERGYIQKSDVELVQVWLQTLIEVQYVFPQIKNTHASCSA